MVACGVRKRRTPDDAIVVLIESNIRDLDPRFALTNHDIKLSRLVAPGLTAVDGDTMEPRLELASAIEQLGPTSYLVTLRDGAKFSSGRAITAADVVWTYESTMASETGSLYQRGFEERFAKVEAVGERQVRFTLVEPLATILTDFDFGIIEKAAANAKGRFEDGLVVGAGPYQVVSRATAEIVLVRNPNYHGVPVATDRIIVRTVRDANARTLMLIGGSADFTQNSIRVDLVDDVAARSRVTVQTGPSSILTYLMMQNDDPLLKDVRVRKAIAYALDRRRIVDSKFGGRAVLATGLLAPAHWAYSDAVTRYDHDPKRAMALLDEAGYPDPDGPGGEPRMRLSYKTSADPFRLSVARVIAVSLSEIGIEVEVRAFEFGTFFADIKKGNFQLASMQTADIADPDYYYSYFHSSRIPSKDNPDSGNRWHYRSARVDALTDEGRHQPERDKRLEIYREVQALVADDVPIVPLWHEDNVALMNKTLSGYRVSANARLGALAETTKN